MLAVVTVGLVATTFYGISDLTKEAADAAARPIEHKFDVMGADLKVDVFGNCKIYLRNLGTDDVPIEVIDFSVDGKPVSISPAIGIIKKTQCRG